MTETSDGRAVGDHGSAWKCMEEHGRAWKSMEEHWKSIGRALKSTGRAPEEHRNVEVVARIGL